MEIKIWQIRTEKDISMDELVNKTGISKATIYRIENGQVSPRLSQLKEIAKALDTKISSLYDDEFK